jgi:hypothetical protein
MAGKAEDLLLSKYQLLKQQGPFARPLFSSNNHSGDVTVIGQNKNLVKLRYYARLTDRRV